MKALVTGGAGFIGSHVVREVLREGWEVRVLDDLSTGYRVNIEGLPIEFLEGDIRDAPLVLRATRGVDAVFHLAAHIGNVKSLERPAEDSSVNAMGTVTLLDAVVKNGVQRFVYSSSAAIFGELQGDVVTEDNPQNPTSPYGVSKLAGEKYALCYGRLHPLVVVCLRYFNVFGLNQRYDTYGNVIPIFAHRIQSGRPLTVYGDGLQTRDFVNARDVARVNFLAATRVRESGVFNVGSGQSITIGTLASMMCELSGIRVPVEYAPPRPGEVVHCRADIGRLRDQLGFRPQADLFQGLSEYWRWFVADGAKRP